jgi:hypothetical protein
MITAGEGIHPVIPCLAAQLLRELELVATFWVEDRIDDPEPLLDHLYRRGVAIIHILASLDVGANLSLDGEPVPYALGPASAVPDVALAGYAGPGAAAIPPGRLAEALLQQRLETLTADEPGTAELDHLFRAAAWVAYMGGVPAGIEYLLALVSHGHVLDPRAAGEAAGILIVAAAGDPTPDDFRATLQINSADHEDWWAVLPPTDWLVPALSGAPVTSLVMLVLEAGWAARRAALAAPDVDTWLTCLRTTSRLVAFAQTAVDRALAKPSVSVRAILAQLGELRADVHALRVAFGLDSLPGCLDYEHQVRSEIAANAAPAMASRRFRAERQLASDRLLARPTPVDWFTPSWRIAPAFRACSGGASPFARAGPRMPGRAYPGDEPAPPDVDEVMATLGRITELVDAGEWYEGGVAAGRLVYDFPWCDLGYWKAAQCFRGLGQHEEALDMMVPAIALQPVQPVLWDSLAFCLGELGDSASAELAASVAEQLGELDMPSHPTDEGEE